MSLNVEKNTDFEALQWWNYDLNREDILHDAENIKELQKNRLFNIQYYFICATYSKPKKSQVDLFFLFMFLFYSFFS